MRLVHLIEDLNLTEKQRPLVDALIEKMDDSHPTETERAAKWEEKRAYYTALFDAFGKDPLDVAAVNQAEEKGNKGG